MHERSECLSGTFCFLNDFNYMKKTKGKLVPKEKTKYAGIHLIAEFWGCRKIIEDPKEIKRILIEAAKAAGNIPLEVTFHKFSPQGMTGVVLLAESHIALHSWPEMNYLAIDIFTCGEKAMPKTALLVLKKYFQPKKVKIIKIKRGVIS